MSRTTDDRQRQNRSASAQEGPLAASHQATRSGDHDSAQDLFGGRLRRAARVAMMQPTNQRRADAMVRQSAAPSMTASLVSGLPVTAACRLILGAIYRGQRACRG